MRKYLCFVGLLWGCNQSPLDNEGWKLRVTGTITGKYETRTWAVTNLKDDCDLLLSRWQRFKTTDEAWCEPSKWTNDK